MTGPREPRILMSSRWGSDQRVRGTAGEGVFWWRRLCRPPRRRCAGTWSRGRGGGGGGGCWSGVEGGCGAGGDGACGCGVVRWCDEFDGSRISASSEETEDAAHQRVEWGASVALSEVCCSETSDETVDLEARHGLVAEAKTRLGSAAEDQAPAPSHGAILHEGEDRGPVQAARAAGEGGEVVGVFEVLRKHDVAVVEECCEG